MKIPKKILIVNIFGVGDILFTTPLVRNLKRHWPDAFIGYICNKRTAPLLQNNPGVDKVFVYERDDYQGLSRRESIIKIYRLMEDIKQERFDLAFDLSLNRYASFLMRMAGIPERIGFHYKGRGFFLTKKIPLKGYEEKHVVEYYLGLLKQIGLDAQDKRLEVFPSNEDEQWVEAFFSRAHISKTDTVAGLVPGGGASWGSQAVYKHWAAEKYAKLADKMIEKFSVKVILLGDKNEEILCAKVAERMRHSCFRLAGQTTLNQMVALFKRCSVAVLNDGGPLHVAVAAGTKTVSIFGPVDERVYGPYPADGHRIVKKTLACHPCYRHFRVAECEHHLCLDSIDIQDVFAQVERIL